MRKATQAGTAREHDALRVAILCTVDKYSLHVVLRARDALREHDAFVGKLLDDFALKFHGKPP
jgi:hypothetical protein